MNFHARSDELFARTNPSRSLYCMVGFAAQYMYYVLHESSSCYSILYKFVLYRTWRIISSTNAHAAVLQHFSCPPTRRPYRRQNEPLRTKTRFYHMRCSYCRNLSLHRCSCSTFHSDSCRPYDSYSTKLHRRVGALRAKDVNNRTAYIIYILLLCYPSIDHWASDGNFANLWTLIVVNDGATRDGHDGHEATTVSM